MEQNKQNEQEITTEQKDFSKFMNLPFNDFETVQSIAYLDAVKVYSQKISQNLSDDWEVGSPSAYAIMERLNYEFNKAGIKTSVRMGIKDLFEELISRTQDYCDLLYAQADERLGEILNEMESQTSDEELQ